MKKEMTKQCVAIFALCFYAIISNAQNINKSSMIPQNKNTFINPTGLFDASKNGFSHIGITETNTKLVFISGQWASDESGNITTEDYAKQVVKSIENLKLALSVVELTEKDIIKLTIYIANYTPEKKQALLQAAAPLLNLKVFPASTIVAVPVLPAHPKALIEIEAIATK